MKLQVKQNSVGNFNIIAPSEEQFSFMLAIVDDDGIIIKEGETPACLRFYTHDIGEACYFDDPIDNLEDVFERCFKYANTTFSTNDYKAQCMLFAKTYQSNFDEINKSHEIQNTNYIKKEIERLQKSLGNNLGVPDLSWAINNSIGKEIEKYRRWIDSNLKDMEQLKKSSDMYKEKLKTNNGYELKINELEKLITKEEE